MKGSNSELSKMDAPTRSMTSEFPVKTKQKVVIVNHVTTEILCSRFEDKLFLIVSQYNKLGNLVEVTRDVVLDDTITPSRPSYSTKVLMGRDEPLIHVIAKNLLAKVDIKKPVLLAVALKDESPQAVSMLSEAVKEVIQ